jgi:sugar lactone lactonase YvrE
LSRALRTFSVDVAVRATAVIGEGPVFDPRTGRLCWVDIAAGLLHESALTSGEQVVTPTGTLLGAVAPRADRSGFAVAVAEGLGFLEAGVLTVADPVLPEPWRRMNDAKCDSSGRLWAGSTHVDFLPGHGVLHRWDGESPSRPVLDGLSLPNGIGWSPADDTMYLADSVQRVVLAAPFAAAEGHVGDFEVLCSVDQGLPDGLAVDVEGCLWLALWGGYEVRRYDSRGRVVGRIPMPVAQPSSCAFAPDGTLYITSARDGLTAAELAEQPLAGSVFAASTGLQGVAVEPFAR